MSGNTYVYSDIDPFLETDGVGNIKVRYDFDVIDRSIKNIVGTVTNERVRNPIGSTLVAILFQPISKFTVQEIRQEIRDKIERYEPRVNLIDITVIPDYDANAYDLDMTYTVTGLSGKGSFRTKIKSFSEGV